MSDKKYKVWVHLEVLDSNLEPIEDENGNDLVLPMSAGIYDSVQEAEDIMAEISNLYETE